MTYDIALQFEQEQRIYADYLQQEEYNNGFNDGYNFNSPDVEYQTSLPYWQGFGAGFKEAKAELDRKVYESGKDLQELQAILYRSKDSQNQWGKLINQHSEF